MATVEVPFETKEQIEEKLATFGELFKRRYTKEDKWYSRTCQVPER